MESDADMKSDADMNAAIDVAMAECEALELRARQARVALKRLIEKSRLAPCLKCGRRVPWPCNDASSYHENGPWDGSCREVF